MQLHCAYLNNCLKGIIVEVVSEQAVRIITFAIVSSDNTILSLDCDKLYVYYGM